MTMTPDQAQEITDKLDKALALLQEVKVLLEGGYTATAGEWLSSGTMLLYEFGELDTTGIEVA